jgi:hypothetical protein
VELNLHFTVFLYFLWGLTEHVEKGVPYPMAHGMLDLLCSVVGENVERRENRREREHAKAIYLMG